MSNGTECFQLRNGRKVSTLQTVLCPSKTGNASTCCFNGDVCLPDGLCGISHEEDGASGFYVGMCTDRNFPSPACRTECGDLPVQDVVFDSQRNTWACCNITSFTSANENGRRLCDKPTNETLRAGPPASLLSAAGPNAEAVVTASPSASSTSTLSTATPAASSAPSDPPSPGLSVQAGVGIGLGLAVGIAILIAVLALCARARRGRQPVLLAGVGRDREPATTGEIQARAIALEVDGVEKPVESADTPKPALELSSSWHLAAELDGRDQAVPRELDSAASSRDAQSAHLGESKQAIHAGHV